MALETDCFVKGQSQFWDGADLDTSFLSLKRLHPNLKSIHFNLRSVSLDFHSFNEKPVFECAFAHPIMLFYHIWLKKVWTVSYTPKSGRYVESNY